VIHALRIHRSLPTAAQRIPDLLVRDLFVAVQLTEERPSAQSRLDDALGAQLAGRLVRALATRPRRAA
jgi:hypothetical protein